MRVERHLLRHAQEGGPLDRHERRVERLNSQLARELEAGVEERSVVRVAACDEEVALRSEGNARVIDTSDLS